MSNDARLEEAEVANVPPPLPGASPLPPAFPPVPPDVEFFDLDSRRATMREYAFESKNPLVLAIAGLLKLLRVRLPGGSTDDPTVDRLAPFEVPFDDALLALPEHAREPAGERLDALLALGYVEPVVHVIRTPLQNTDHAMVTLHSPAGRSIARVHVRTSHHKVPPKVKPFVEFLTPLADGRFVWTANGVPDTIEPASCLWRREKSLDVAQTHALHEQRLAEHEAAIVPTPDAEAVRDFVEAHHAAVVAFHRGRKFFTTVDPAAARLRAEAAAGGDPADAPVLVEIDRQLNKGGSWQGAIVLFLVTLFAFVALGANQWGGRFVAMLVPILFFHELGHYVAMRGFGYRNVRMFFLPLMGAAVSGRSFNVAAWKQVIVALAGPVPGILLAIPIGIAGVATGRAWLNELAMLTFILNGFNLLPILPLDGGRVAQLLLFRRAPILDVAFRVVAVFAIVGLALLSHDRFLGYFAVALGLSVPMAVRVARATRVLRKRRAGQAIAVPDGARTLPPAVAGEIVAELRRGAKRPIATKILATQALEVFDALNAPAPRWAATVGLGFVHVASIGLMAAGAVTFALLNNPAAMRAFAQLAQPRPMLDPTDVENRRGDAYEAAAAHDVIVAKFKEPARAAKAFASLAVPEAGAACRLGPAIVVELPAKDMAARDAAFDALEAAGGEPSVEDGGWATMTLIARTSGPKAADAIAEAVGSNGMPDALIPPWMTPDPRPAAERAAHDRARRTDAAMQRVRDAEVKAAIERMTGRVKAFGAGEDDDADDADAEQKAISAARRRGNQAEAARLSRARFARERAATLAAIDAAVAALPTADPEYVALWKAIHFPPEELTDGFGTGETAADAAKFKARLAARQAEHERLDRRRREMLGSLPRATTRPTDETIAWWADAGASTDERVVTLRITQRSPAVTLPAVVRWLGERSIDLRFDLGPVGDWMERRYEDDEDAATRPTTAPAD